MMTTKQKLCSIQYLRAIAAIMVVYAHIVHQVDQYEKLLPFTGRFGVDIFFVISGFIMIYISRSGTSPKEFLLHRIRRVVPLYWFFTFLMSLLLIVAPWSFKNAIFSTPALFESLFFIPHRSLGHPEWVWPIVAPGWSLNHEMYFYLLFSVFITKPLYWRTVAITGVITVFYVLAQASGSTAAMAMFLKDAIVFEFVFGMVLGTLYVRGFTVSPAIAVLMFVLGGSALLMDLPLERILAFGLPATCVVAGVLFMPVPVSRMGLLLGEASYALYLSHIFTLGITKAVFTKLYGDGVVSAWLFAGSSMLICLLAAVAIHLYIDNWLLRAERFSELKRLFARSRVAH